MASLTKDRRLLFKAPDGKRKTIRLGSKTPIKQARLIQRHVERLVACQLDGSAPPEATSRWIDGINERLHDRLVRCGLIQCRVSVVGYTLGQLMDDYKARPKWQSFKPSTIDNKLRAFGYMLDHFGSSQPIREITVAASEDFYGKLLLPKDKGGRGLGVATCNQVATIGYALLNYAIDAERLDRNPFKVLPRAARKGDNSTVSEADSVAVLKHMTDTQQRLLFGLSRWGGLRIPSEAKGLRWCDIDWERNRFLVHSPKTERHEGRGERWVPIFPELAPLLDARFTDAADGDDYVLPTVRQRQNTHCTRVLELAIKRAGLDRWPRMWHSLRSTRQTELVERFPVHVVCKWLGNSIDVATTHYLKTTEQHFDEAAGVAQKAAQTIAVNVGTTKKNGTSSSGVDEASTRVI